MAIIMQFLFTCTVLSLALVTFGVWSLWVNGAPDAACSGAVDPDDRALVEDEWRLARARELARWAFAEDLPEVRT